MVGLLIGVCALLLFIQTTKAETDPERFICIQTKTGHSNSVESVTFSPDNQWLASGSEDNKVKIWNTSDWSCIKTLSHSSYVYSVAFSLNNQWLASCSYYDKSIKIWNISDWSCIKTITHSYGFLCLAFSPNNQWLVSSSYDKNIQIWNTSDWSCIKTLSHSSDVYSLAFSPDNQWLTSGTFSGTIMIWDTSDWSLKKTLNKHSSGVNGLAFSQNNEWLASGSNDRTIIIWDTSGWWDKKTLTGHSKDVLSIGFSPNNKLLASGSQDNKIKIWDTSDWGCKKTLTGHSSKVNSVAFSPNNKWLASGSADEKIKIWGNGADLTLSSIDISFSKSDITLGDTVTIYAKIHNIGLRDANNVFVNFYDEEELIGSDTIDVLEGEMKTTSVEWNVSTGGMRTIYVKIDEEKNIPEEDETNNEAHINVIVKAPDLSVTQTDISFSRETIVAGESLKIYAIIHNIGSIEATNVIVNFYDEKELINSDIIDVLTGKTVKASVEWNVPSLFGKHTIFINIDEACNIVEEDETNNEASIEANVRGADLTITPNDISFSKENIIACEIYVINAKVKNIGLGNATNVIVNFYDDIKLLGFDKINVIANNTHRASIEWEVPILLGIHMITVKIDEQNNTIEENETNNIANKNIEVIIRPVAIIESITPNPARESEIINFDGIVNDDVFIEKYFWNSSVDGFLSQDKLFSLSNLSNGTHTIYFKVKDNNGIWSEEVSKTLIINGIPIAKIIEIDPNTINNLVEISFNGTYIDFENNIVGFYWESNIDGFLSDKKEFSTSILSNGTHYISFKVKDNFGVFSDTAYETLRKNGKPVAHTDYIFPNPANEKENIEFLGHGIDDVTINEYLWESNIDGFLSDKKSCLLSNLSIGNHTITFQVKDNENIWSEEVSVKLIIIENIIMSDEIEESESNDDYKIYTILPIIGLIITVGIVGFILHRQKSFMLETLPSSQETHFQQIPQMQQPQTQHIRKPESSTLPTPHQAFKLCPYCNAQVPGQFKFCNMCGKQIGQNH